MNKRISKASGPILAAQYIRMSTEHQRFSPDNQRAANLAYAKQHGYEIVQTYLDAGKSGLTLKARPELKRLLSDVLGGEAPYQAILVLDVSRWGRFQDADQAAHYEYMCREAGVPVRYCSEAFDNDGGAMASIVKHMKRVMAAEYSRELSTKVSRAQRQQARLGFKQGGSAVLGTRRQVVDEQGRLKRTLRDGEGKILKTDRVRHAPGPAREISLVRRIYEMYASQEMRLGQICAALNREGKTQTNGNPWNSTVIRRVLEDSIYIGRYVFGRTYNNLGDKFAAPLEEWSDVEVMEAIVAPSLFSAAAIRLQQTTRRLWSDQEIVDGLAKLLNERGALSRHLVARCAYLPQPCTITSRYGSLTAAFKLVGYEIPNRWLKKRDGSPYSDDELLVALCRIYATKGYISGAAINEDPSKPGSKYYIRRFGSLLTAYRLAGLNVTLQTQRQEAALRRRQPDYTPEKIPKVARRRNIDGSKITDEQMLIELAQLLQLHGHLSMALIDAAPNMRSSANYGQRFGGMKSAYAKVGYFNSQSQIIKATCMRAKAASASTTATN